MLAESAVEEGAAHMATRMSPGTSTTWAAPARSAATSASGKASQQDEHTYEDMMSIHMSDMMIPYNISGGERAVHCEHCPSSLELSAS